MVSHAFALQYFGFPLKAKDIGAVIVPGGHCRNFWVGMCRWEPGTLNLHQS